MLTKETVLICCRGKKSKCLDGRDFARLVAYFHEDAKVFGYELKEGQNPDSKAWTKENILEELEGDLAFAFEKALDKRGISSTLMHEVIRMWLWILEDELQHATAYAMYGLPLYKAVALKYGFPNPIGNDTGSEEKYNEESEG